MPSRGRAVCLKAGKPPQPEQRGADAAGCTVDQEPLAVLGAAELVEVLIGREVVDNQAAASAASTWSGTGTSSPASRQIDSA